MKPLLWMRAVRDHRPKPGPRSARYPVLWALALRMDKDGIGYCSTRQLADDAEAGERTVRRHLVWARETGFLVRTRKGHRVSDDTVLASEWRLTQPATGDHLDSDPTGQMEHPNRPDEHTQPASQYPPRGLSPLGLSSMSSAPNGAGVVAAANEQPSNADPTERWMTLDRQPTCKLCGRPWARDAKPSPDGLCRDCISKHAATMRAKLESRRRTVTDDEVPDIPDGRRDCDHCGRSSRRAMVRDDNLCNCCAGDDPYHVHTADCPQPATTGHQEDT